MAGVVANRDPKSTDVNLCKNSTKIIKLMKHINDIETPNQVKSVRCRERTSTVSKIDFSVICFSYCFVYDDKSDKVELEIHSKYTQTMIVTGKLYN